MAAVAEPEVEPQDKRHVRRSRWPRGLRIVIRCRSPFRRKAQDVVQEPSDEMAGSTEPATPERPRLTDTEFATEFAATEPLEQVEAAPSSSPQPELEPISETSPTEHLAGPGHGAATMERDEDGVFDDTATLPSARRLVEPIPSEALLATDERQSFEPTRPTGLTSSEPIGEDRSIEESSSETIAPAVSRPSFSPRVDDDEFDETRPRLRALTPASLSAAEDEAEAVEDTSPLTTADEGGLLLFPASFAEGERELDGPWPADADGPTTALNDEPATALSPVLADHAGEQPACAAPTADVILPTTPAPSAEAATTRALAELQASAAPIPDEPLMRAEREPRVARDWSALKAWGPAILLPVSVAWLAPPLLGLSLALGGLLLLRSREDSTRTRLQTADTLAWSALVLSALTLTAAALAPKGVHLTTPALPWSIATGWLLPAGLLGLMGALALSLRLGTRATPVTTASGLAACVGFLGCGFSLPSTALVMGSSLLASATVCFPREGRLRHRARKAVASTWGVLGTCLLLVGLMASALSPSTLAFTITAALVVGSAMLSSSRDRSRALAAAGLGLATLSLIQLGHVLGLNAISCLALTWLVPATLYASELLSQPRLGRPNGPSWRAGMARVLASAATLAVLAVMAVQGPHLLGSLVLCLSAVVLAVERRLGGRAVLAVASTAALGGAAGIGLVTVGLAPAWLPTLLPAACATILLTGERLPGHTRRRDWTQPLFGCLLVASGLGVTLALLGLGMAGLSATGLALGAAVLLREDLRLARGLLPLFGVAVACALTCSLGVPALGLPLAAAGALLAWSFSEKKRELLYSVGMLVCLCLGITPFVALGSSWAQAGLSLLLLAGLGGLELRRGQRETERGLGQVAAGLLVLGPVAALALTAAKTLGPDLPLAMLGLALILQCLDVLARDNRVSLWLRGSSAVAWLAGLLVSLQQAYASEQRTALLVGLAALVALALAGLRRSSWPAFLAGLCAAVATGFMTASAGMPVLQSPALFLAPAATWIVAWGVLQSVSGRNPNVSLYVGLSTLCGAMLAQAHLAGAPGVLRVGAAALGLFLVITGCLARHRAPVSVGVIALAVESLFLLGDAFSLWAANPLDGIGVLALVLVVGGVLLARLAVQAGGLDPLTLAWQTEFLRLQGEWKSWT